MIPCPPPPNVTDLPYGYRLVAGTRFSTVLADFDFETYSEAGYVWNATANKWESLPGVKQGKKGLPVVGAAVYARDPSADIVRLAYNLKDGRGKRWWVPYRDPLPVDLFLHLYEGKLIEAWNVSFERWAWNQIAVPKYGFPPLPESQLRCAMAKSRAWQMPGKLELAAYVLGTSQKDSEGTRLMRKFSMPRNPTKTNPRKRIRLEDDPIDGPKYEAYNDQDIVAEANAVALIPDLSPPELEYWQCDQAINARGVHVDRKAVHACIAIINQALAHYNAELRALTGGAVDAASELAKLQGWIGAHGVLMPSMDEDAIIEALDWDLPDNVRRALEIRATIGSASVKKVFAMANQMTADDRLHDLYSFHAARTGRPTGNGPQPQNLPNSGPDVYRCATCTDYFGTHHKLSCPWCGLAPREEYKPIEWNHEAVESALRVIALRDLATLEYYFGDALAVISGCLRGLFIASDGCELICADYTAIEAVVSAVLAGEQWRIDLFKARGKIYEASGATIFGLDYQTVIDYAKANGHHHPCRKVGKVGELACFGADTEVLTDHGYMPIIDVRETYKLWDGVEWVTHGGLVNKGIREVIELDGIVVTPDHKIICGNSWREAKELASNESILYRSLASGSMNLPSPGLTTVRRTLLTPPAFPAPVLRPYITWISTTCSKVPLPGAILALRKNQKLPSKTFGSTPPNAQMTNTGAGCSADFPPPFSGATTQNRNNVRIMAAGAFRLLWNGEKIKHSFCATWSHLTDGITRLLKWTGLIRTETTSPEISGSLPKQKTVSINEACKPCSENLTFTACTFDLANAGPRSRFTIRTNSGHLLVHNSGFGGWIGTWLAFGAGEFMTDDEIKKAILAWREKSPAIVEMWGGQQRGYDGPKELYGLEGMAISAILNPGTEYAYRGIRYKTVGDALYCKLLSGRYIVYHRPRLEASTKRPGQLQIVFEGYNSNPVNGPIGWLLMKTYGGRLFENVVQATANDIYRHASVNCERRGYPIVLHTYDELTADKPIGTGTPAELEAIMSEMPVWAEGWPIYAAGGWARPRYGK